MNVLASCDILILSRLSTFSFCASALGNILPLIPYPPPNGVIHGYIAEPCMWNYGEITTWIKDSRDLGIKSTLALHAPCSDFGFKAYGH